MTDETNTTTETTSIPTRYAKDRAPLPERAAATSTLIDEETLDLSVPEPTPTEHLSLNPQQAARYANGCWALDPGQSLGLKLRLAEEDQLTLTFELYCPEDPAIRAFYQEASLSDWRTLLSLQTGWGGEDLSRFGREGRQSLNMTLPGDPLAQTFLKVTTPLLPLPEVGENDCTLWYLRDTLKTLLVRSVTLKRFRVQRQEQTQWCWAAVTASLMSLLDPNNQTQSSVVHESLTSDDLNRPQDLTEIARKLGLAVKYTSRQLALYELRDGINQGLPIPLQINWRKADGELGAGHYVVLTGIGPDVSDEGQTLIKIEDPSKGELQMTFAELKDDYPGAANKHLYAQAHSGVWTYTHRIEKKPARQKAEKHRAPKLTTSAARNEFARQWEASRPPEGPEERMAAVEAELARLRQIAERESHWRVHTYAWGEKLESAVEAREQRVVAMFQHQLRLLWVRELLTPLGVLGEPMSFELPGEKKPPSFFDKKK